jgi:hypothetical protein
LTSQSGLNVVLRADKIEIILLIFDEDLDQWFITGHQSSESADGIQPATAAFCYNNTGYLDEALNGYAELQDHNNFEYWMNVYRDLGLLPFSPFKSCPSHVDYDRCRLLNI